MIPQLTNKNASGTENAAEKLIAAVAAEDNAPAAEEKIAREEEEFLEEDEQQEEDEAFEEGHADAVGKAATASEEAKSTAVDGSDINVECFEELKMEKVIITATCESWRLFLNSADSREAAGEAIYSALFEGAPSLQSLFTTPRAVQAMRFMNGLASFVGSLEDPPKLKVMVETLGFGHLHLDVTKPRVVIFRDAILDLFAVELGDRFTVDAGNGWKRLLNYVGGAIIFVKANYAVRINTLLESWKNVNDKASNKDKFQQLASADTGKEQAQTAVAGTEGARKKLGWTQFRGGNKKRGQRTDKGAEEGKASEQSSSIMNANQVPTTYDEMFKFNAAVMGFGGNVWLNEVLACFNNIVTNVSNSARLQEECSVLVLRISRIAKGNVNFSEYKSCMLASLRSLLPKDWSTSHEVAWSWLWENVERLLAKDMGNPRRWEKALGKFYDALDENAAFEIRKSIYTRFFAAAPAGQDFFKQSNTYLHFIAERIMGMTIELYREPVKMVDDISALGLRHVGYGIPTELFGPFVSACVEVLGTVTSDQDCIESFSWSLALISKMLVRTITEGSTIVMKAVNSNSIRLLKKAIGCAPRGERATWCLIVQVGTQDISPLSWAIESAALEAAKAMITDLLTIRADRDRYYYSMDQLFNRHPDIVRRLCNDAPVLLPTLLSGLIWRSRTTENGQRRVNYYIKHILVDQQSAFNQNLSWIAKTKDPKIVCHASVVFSSDILWARVACQSFLYRKSWLLFTLSVFITGQSIFKHLNEGENSQLERILIFSFRTFIYGCSMTALLYSHLSRWAKAYRSKELTYYFGVLPLPAYLNNWQNIAGFALMVSLVLMLILEPILHCFQNDGGKLFYEECEEVDDLQFFYAIFSMCAMFLYYGLLIDLAVLSTKVSAYVLVCSRMMAEIGLFLLSLVVVMLTFSSAMSILKHDQQDFSGIHEGLITLSKVTMKMYDGQHYEEFESDPLILTCVFIFLVVVTFFLVNMLIAQLTCAYESVYMDMVGYARLERLQVIVATMPSVSAKRWDNFLSFMKFEQKTEFNAGDVGVTGGVQIMEPASANPTTIDMIRRFGGSTSTEMPWPAEDEEGNDDDRFDKLEKLIQKTLKRVTSACGKKGGPGSGFYTFTGTSSSGKDQDEGSGTDSRHSGASDEELEA